MDSRKLIEEVQRDVRTFAIALGRNSALDAAWERIHKLCDALEVTEQQLKLRDFQIKGYASRVGELEEEVKLADKEARVMRDAYADALREWAEGGKAWKLEQENERLRELVNQQEEK